MLVRYGYMALMVTNIVAPMLTEHIRGLEVHVMEAASEADTKAGKSSVYTQCLLCRVV